MLATTGLIAIEHDNETSRYLNMGRLKTLKHNKVRRVGIANKKIANP